MWTSALRSSLSCHCILRQTISKINYKQILTVESKRGASLYNHTQLRWKSGREVELSSLFIPDSVPPVNNGDNIGEELTKKINKDDILKIINKFYDEINEQPEVEASVTAAGLDSKLLHKAKISFTNFCMKTEILPVDLHIILSDILRDADHLHSILPYFLKHVKDNFPHLKYNEELKKISDLRQPADWYPQARKIKRKLIFHAGPTNSGKTYKALERFVKSKTGVYCGPLKLLSVEVFNKTNERGTPCDLVTGEERQRVLPNNTPADHVACTIEMVSVENKYEVAVIDEIQMLKDPGRGWAWTRALLGLVAEEIHICGEEAAIDLVKEIARSCGEELMIKKYERLTNLTIENNALEDLHNIQPGDCIVCFNKQDIYRVSLELEKKGFECAVIYGGLPPGTKLAQAKKFNDPLHDCKILVATDAIGMGLNLSIRRVIFYSLKKTEMNEEGEKEIKTISTSQALQIGGRAGRFNTQFSEGFVTTFRPEDLSNLKDIMSKNVEPLERAGLYPTAEQVELFAYYLRNATLSYLIDFFVCLCKMNTSTYFMCDTEGFKSLADEIQHIRLPLRARYVFCCAPVNRNQSFVLTMFVRFAKQYSQNDPLTVEKLCQYINWPLSPPKNIDELKDLEAVFDVLDLYLWLSYRFLDLFPHAQVIRSIQKELDKIIQLGVLSITHLIASKATNSSEDQVEEDKGLSKLNKYVSSLSTDLTEKAITSEESSHGKFGYSSGTQKLLSQGNVTTEMLITILKEWEDYMKKSDSPTPFAKINSKVQKLKAKRK